MKNIFISNEEAMLEWGGELAERCRSGDVIFLKGQLGAGKTTLVRGFLRKLGYLGKVKSPTYSLVETYILENYPDIIHFDLYRLNHPQELLDIGLEDYLAAAAIFLIEWPEKAEHVLPKPTLECTIVIPENEFGRIITTHVCEK
jgi:tRNA threonylcarbamoyladenosine biosynthesis protein TsaE